MEPTNNNGAASGRPACPDNPHPQVEPDAHAWAHDADLRQKHKRPRPTWLVTLGLSYSAIGVIYGDIGTSPLYTVQTVFSNVDVVEHNHILMVISMIFWTLTLVVLFKYVLVVLQADDRGEGGTFALYTLICRTLGISPYGALQKKEHAQLLNMSKRPTLARTGIHRVPTTTHPAARTQADQRLQEQVWRATLVARAEQAQHEDEVEQVKPRWFQKGSFDPEPIKHWFHGNVLAQRVLLVVAIISTSMVIGDGVFTPALSVVSAIAGLEVAVDDLHRDVVIGVSCAILVLLFTFQYKGTRAISIAFSPIVILWLLANTAIGIWQLVDKGPEIFKAFSPHWIGRYFAEFGLQGWIMMGSIMLCVTGAEAMYSDLGHFDKPSTMLSFTGFVYPCLILTYMGQGAYLLDNLEDVTTAYWSFVPDSVAWPMLVLATAATIVASQALISACFSITKQAKVLGFMPKLKITHTSDDRDGQIYVAAVNWILMLLTVAVTAGFQANPVSLALAYGLTISVVMLITDILIVVVMLVHWKLNVGLVALFLVLFGTIDLTFVCANFTKVPNGGWVAIAITAAASTVMLVWWAGQRKRRLEEVAHGHIMPEDLFTFTTVGAKRKLKVEAPYSPRGKSTNGGGALGSSSATIATAADSASPRQTAAAAASLSQSSSGLPAHRRKPSAGQPLGEAVEAGPVAESSTYHRGSVEQLHRGTTLVCGPEPTREELALLRGEFNLALKVPGATSKPLNLLPGIGLYYANNASIVPPVLCNAMRNLEAVHKINIFVCVRHLPIPHVDPEDRLLVRCVPNVPNMYQCITRYGYLEHIDHGKAFVNELISAIVHLLEVRAGLDATEGTLDALQDATISLDSPFSATQARQQPQQPRASQDRPSRRAPAGPVAEGRAHLMDHPHVSALLQQIPSSSPQRTLSRQRSVNGSVPHTSVELREISSTGLQSSKSVVVPALMVPNQPRLAVDVSGLSQTLRSTSLGTVLSQRLVALGVQDGAMHDEQKGFERLTMIAESLQKGDVEVSARLEDAALRVSALLNAAEEGVVFYFGRTTLRMKPGSNIVHAVLYDTIYRTMMQLAYAEAESWRVPCNNLVELGMVLFL